jgi:inosine/xanthosine triphosphate pyrophosphatase family protein
MHIKSVSIQGFKSYKDQVNLEAFSPKHNVIGKATTKTKTRHSPLIADDSLLLSSWS